MIERFQVMVQQLVQGVAPEPAAEPKKAVPLALHLDRRQAPNYESVAAREQRRVAAAAAGVRQGALKRRQTAASHSPWTK